MCFMCNAGMHESCTDFDCLCAMNNHSPTIKGQNEPERTLESSSDFGDRSSSNHSRTGNGKRDSALKDQQSTGRKRAAKLYPLDETASCEWQNKKNCGGGPKPILGCIEGLQQARHHGPDKSVTNNDEGNVHRICHGCHYRWHAANDPSYDWNAAVLTSHKPLPMADNDRQDAVRISLKMMANKNIKIKD